LHELRRSADDMSAAELDRARAQMKAGLLMGLESPSARAERNARLVAIWDRVPPLEETVARIDAVSLEGLRAHAAALTASGRSALALYGPVGAPRIWPASGSVWPPDAQPKAAPPDRDRQADPAPAAACRFPRLGRAARASRRS
jgi:hypothetical protein